MYEDEVNVFDPLQGEERQENGPPNGIIGAHRDLTDKQSSRM